MIQQFPRTGYLTLTFIFLLFLPAGLSARGLGMGGSGRIEGKYSFMPIPYVNYDRSLGFSVGAVPMLMFNPTEKDTISPSSLIGEVGFWTTNKTWFLMGFGMFYLDSPIDTWIPYQIGEAF